MMSESRSSIHPGPVTVPSRNTDQVVENQIIVECGCVIRITHDGRGVQHPQTINYNRSAEYLTIVELGMPHSNRSRTHMKLRANQRCLRLDGETSSHAVEPKELRHEETGAGHRHAAARGIYESVLQSQEGAEGHDAVEAG